MYWVVGRGIGGRLGEVEAEVEVAVEAEGEVDREVEAGAECDFSHIPVLLSRHIAPQHGPGTVRMAINKGLTC